jgi:hypothetical protein
LKEFEVSRYCKYLCLETLSEEESVLDKVVQDLNKYFNNKTNAELLYFYMQNLEESWGSTFSKVFSPFETSLPEQIVINWENTAFTEEAVSTLNNVYKNVENIKALGIEKTIMLNNEFGISCFGRYPYELLSRQFNNFSNRENLQNLTWFVGGLVDKNGAFYQDTTLYEDYMKDLKLPQPMVVETVSTRSLLSRLMKIKEDYSIDIPTIVVLSGHGTSESVSLGVGEFGVFSNNVLTESIVEKGIKPLIEGSVVIFNSCAAGGVTLDEKSEDIFSDNIAEELSTRCNVTTIAPEEPITGIRDLKVVNKDGEVDVSLKFISRSKGSGQYKTVRHKVYGNKD